MISHCNRGSGLINFVGYSLGKMPTHSEMLSLEGLGVYTTAQLSEVLGYTIQHTRWLIRTNRLNAIKVGRDWIIQRSDAAAYVAAKERNQATITTKRGT